MFNFLVLGQVLWLDPPPPPGSPQAGPEVVWLQNKLTVQMIQLLTVRF